jgi:hypothetical protein
MTVSNPGKHVSKQPCVRGVSDDELITLAEVAVTVGKVIGQNQGVPSSGEPPSGK